ncbi:metallophosphoesterase family protein [Aliagarivorans marinus]|uniref:metallophosphoesterase family protein n=1 Tax=Aliagarivorans marinus TaxID=561965 RepID=UPI0003FC9592|nr:metallophosphoesterase [Aliagarivorans marinus]
MHFKISALALASAALLSGCGSSSSSDDGDRGGLKDPVSIAFMSDIHFHDVYADFSTEGGNQAFEGLVSYEGNPNATIRTMGAQLGSTRLFNENYFALRAALDDLAERGVKLVAMPGDFSDDGQPVHLRGMDKMLQEYTDKYGMEFFAAPGNHDPVRPFDHEAGKSDYLGADYQNQNIRSLGHGDCLSGNENTICTHEVIHQGMGNVMTDMGAHGFFPKQEYAYFETPFTSEALRDDYSFDLAKEEAALANRQHEICADGTGGDYNTANDRGVCSMQFDASYLVEPIEGLWVLSLDSTVFLPNDSAAVNPEDSGSYSGAQNKGWDHVFSHKEYLVDWMQDVVIRAEEQGKKLVTFSHYPMDDFYGGAYEVAEDYFESVETNFLQHHRLPSNSISEQLAAMGIKLHVGGHMHYNTTSTVSSEGNTLVNIQAPSLAAYVPAYKLVTLDNSDIIEVETVVMDDVRDFDQLFEHYRLEKAAGATWNERVLSSRSYVEMNDYHIMGLAEGWASRWPGETKHMIEHINGRQMMILSQLETDITTCELASVIDLPNTDACAFNSNIGDTFRQDWANATLKAEALALENGMHLRDFVWSGMDLLTDFYRLRNADELAIKVGQLTEESVAQYALVSGALRDMDVSVLEDNHNHPVGEVFKEQFGVIFTILEMLYNRAPSDNFLIDTRSGDVMDMSGNVYR